MFTRFTLAKRWKCSIRKIDRMREEGLLAWLDLSQGRGGRPCVRFLPQDVEEFERQSRLSIAPERIEGPRIKTKEPTTPVGPTEVH